MQFIINEHKRITIHRLTTDPVKENWIYRWYVCKTQNCDNIDNSFYSIKDRNGNIVTDEWISDSFVDYEFFELTPVGESFWIICSVNKNDDCDICRYHPRCPECWRWCSDCAENCGGLNDCIGECYRGEYKQCVELCNGNELCINDCKKKYYYQPCENWQQNCADYPCEKECPGDDKRIPCEQECCMKLCDCPEGCDNYSDGIEIPCSHKCPDCFRICPGKELDVYCDGTCPEAELCALYCCDIEITKFNGHPTEEQIEEALKDERCAIKNCDNVKIECKHYPKCKTYPCVPDIIENIRVCSCCGETPTTIYNSSQPKTPCDECSCDCNYIAIT